MNGYNAFFTNAKNAVAAAFGFGSHSGAADKAEQKKKAETAARVSSGALALQYYDGRAPSQLKVKDGIDDNIFINYAENIVDKSVSFLFGDHVSIQIGDGTDKKGEAILDAVWSKETRDEDLNDLATDGAIFGDAWIKIRINEQSEPEIIVLDPQQMRAETDSSNYKKVLKYIFEMTRADGSIYREETALENGKWIIREFEASARDKRFVQIGDDIVWSWSFAPIFHSKNLPRSKSFYGKADLNHSVLSLCKYISRLDSLVNKICRIHASPKAVARGLQKQDLKMSAEDVLFLPEVEQTISLLEMTSDLVGALAFRKLLRESLSEVSKTPEISTSKTESIGKLSGRALQILYAPLLSKTKQKQLLYGSLLQKVCAALLEIKGQASLAKTVKINFGSPLPPDRREELDIALLEKSLGVSETTLLKRLGFDPETEREQRKDDSNFLTSQLGKIFDSGEHSSLL